MRKELLLFIALLLMAVTGARAQYTVTLKSEYTSVPTIYAGTQNYMTLKITNNGSVAVSNVATTVSDGGVNIFETTIGSISAGETATLNFYDPTIRPITENTVRGNNNENVTYTVEVGGENQGTFPFVVLFNGNLGKDYEYPSANPQLREFTFTGDVQVLTGNNYSGASVTSRDDVFSVDLGEGESVCKALLYVSYNWENPNYNSFTTSTTTFNGNTISSIASYRDQGNLGGYGNYGYGMVVYDVTNYMVSGDNTFHLDKTGTNVAVYPSSLIVMVNKPSGNPKTVYILEEADLLSNTYNKNTAAIYNSSFSNVAIGTDANLYVFAANAQAGEGNLIINGDTYTDVWSGTSQTFDTFSESVAPGDVSIQFQATGSTILALHQMLVVDLIKANEGNTGEYWATYYNATKSYQADVNTTVYTGALNSNKINLTEVTDKKIPAGNAVILKSTQTGITMTPITATGTLAGNDLKGGTTVEDGKVAYTLSRGSSGTGALGFYRLDTSNASLDGNKAHLEMPSSYSLSRVFIGFGDDEATAIKTPAAISNTDDGVVYDLMGRRINGQPTKKGIYVKNGQKNIIK